MGEEESTLGDARTLAVASRNRAGDDEIYLVLQVLTQITTFLEHCLEHSPATSISGVISACRSSNAISSKRKERPVEPAVDRRADGAMACPYRGSFGTKMLDLGQMGRLFHLGNGGFVLAVSIVSFIDSSCSANCFNRITHRLRAPPVYCSEDGAEDHRKDKGLRRICTTKGAFMSSFSLYGPTPVNYEANV